MGLIKNMHLLDGSITEDAQLKMEHAAVEHARYSGISFKIMEVKPKAVTIQISQAKSSAGNYFQKKRLIEIVHETYDRFFPGKKLHVQPIEFIESPANKVDAAWVQKNMLETGTRLKDIAADTGMDYPNLSTYMNAKKPMPQPIKALFYFYFKAKQMEGSSAN